MNLPQRIRKGDLVEAMPMNGKVAPGTVGQVVAVTEAGYRVEWQFVRRPQTKKEMHSAEEIAPLMSDN